MHEIITEIDLHTSATRAWAALIDFPAYPGWNPVIASIDGAPALGSRLRLNLRPEVLEPPQQPVRALRALAFRAWCGLNGMRLVVRVTKLLPQRELRWVGALPVPGMFRGEHFFRISEKRDGGVRFTQGEVYAGLLEPAFREVMEAVNRHAMNAVNQALKTHLEVSIHSAAQQREE
jgi:hypothetical protein